jgi:hypothetical protein
LRPRPWHEASAADSQHHVINRGALAVLRILGRREQDAVLQDDGVEIEWIILAYWSPASANLSEVSLEFAPNHQICASA